MLTEYLKAAMAKARYELLEGGEGFYGEIPGFQGVFAQADSLEACRDELASTLEDWLLFRISRQLPIPVVAGLDLTVKESPAFARCPALAPASDGHWPPACADSVTAVRSLAEGTNSNGFACLAGHSA